MGREPLRGWVHISHQPATTHASPPYTRRVLAEPPRTLCAPRRPGSPALQVRTRRLRIRAQNGRSSSGSRDTAFGRIPHERRLGRPSYSAWRRTCLVPPCPKNKGPAALLLRAVEQRRPLHPWSGPTSRCSGAAPCRRWSPVLVVCTPAARAPTTRMPAPRDARCAPGVHPKVRGPDGTRPAAMCLRLAPPPAPAPIGLTRPSPSAVALVPPSTT